MGKLKNKTPDWPVDMDRVMRKLNLRRQGPEACVTVLACALQDVGYPAQAVQRKVRGAGRELHYNGKILSNGFRNQGQYGVRLGALFLTPELDTDWEQVLRRAHTFSAWNTSEDEQWTTEFVSGEEGVPGADILEYEREYTGKRWRAARLCAATMMHELIDRFNRPGFPAGKPEDTDDSAEAQVRRTLQGILDSGLLRLESAKHTPMGILAVHLASQMVAQGLEVKAMECREYTKEPGGILERTDVFLQEPGRELFYLGERGIGEIRFIRQAIIGPMAEPMTGNSGVRALPQWEKASKLSEDIEAELSRVTSMIIQDRLHRATAPVVAPPAPRQRM